MADPKKQCEIHSYSDGFFCERTNLNNYFEESQKKKILSESVLDITRMFDDRMKSFRKNILLAPQSPMCVQYYQDRTEFQNRGNSHIHGCLWSDFEKLEDQFPGVQKTFKKLKERKHLLPEDTVPLINLVKKTVTCTLKPEKLMEDFGYDLERATKIVKSKCEGYPVYIA